MEPICFCPDCGNELIKEESEDLQDLWAYWCSECGQGFNEENLTTEIEKDED
jgi:DNA-directed RNA polymerase subunit M/transcription elongation factor TFIIS